MCTSQKLSGAALRCWLVICLCSSLCACSLFKERGPESVDYTALAQEPMKPEESQAVLKEATSNWFYGEGLGDTALKAGTVVAFPPFLLVLLGNAALNLSGYESVGVSSVLPEQGAGVWSSFYDTVVSAPGRLTAALAGREFRTDEIANEKMAAHLRRDAPGAEASY